MRPLLLSSSETYKRGRDTRHIDKLQTLLPEKRTGAIEKHERIELRLCQHFTVTERTQAEAGQ